MSSDISFELLNQRLLEKCIECDFVGVLNMDKFPTGVCEKNPADSGSGTEIIGRMLKEMEYANNTKSGFNMRELSTKGYKLNVSKSENDESNMYGYMMKMKAYVKASFTYSFKRFF